MWRHELYVRWRKGWRFNSAIADVAVPVDQLEEAGRLWDGWVSHEEG